MIRILIVDDSPLVVQVLAQIIATDPELCIVGVAHDGKEAVEKARGLKPDLITMDIHMPTLNGVEATKQIMAYSPTPILLFSSAVNGDQMHQAFEALSYGALDAVEKHGFLEGDEIPEEMVQDFIARIKSLSKVKVISHLLGKLEQNRSSSPSHLSNILPGKSLDKMIGIVSSTGGPHALLTVLKEIPPSFPVPIAVVQHISIGFVERLRDWLQSNLSLQIKVAKHKESCEGGVVYLAPSNFQMRIVQEGGIVLTHEPKVAGQKPSGTVLLSSIASAYKSKALGVILTGMGEDGAAGLKAIYDAGGHTIVQDESTSVIFGMPQKAIDLGAAKEILSLSQIASKIQKWGFA